VGKAAVELRAEGPHAVMPAIVRTSHKRYRWKIGRWRARQVANVEKMLPRERTSRRTASNTAKGRRYLAPLIKGGRITRPTRTGCRSTWCSKNKPVRKKLKTAL